MRGLVLAAGLGTRLRPLTEKHAKPALPVLGIPGLWFSAVRLREELKPEAIAVNFSHAPSSLLEAAGDAELRAKYKIGFHFSDESSQILGSSGALWKLKDWIGKETLAVCNGDSICMTPWRRMLEFHRASGALVTLHVRAFSEAPEPYTNIGYDKQGLVMGFGSKTLQGTMFSGSYLFEPSLLSRLPAGVSELRPTILEPLIKEKKLFAFHHDTPWFDTGSVKSYAEAQFELLAAIPELRDLVETKMREVKPGCWIPKSWDATQLEFNAPVILCGAEKSWREIESRYGPRLLGIVPPVKATVENISYENKIIFGNYSQKI